MPKKYRILDLFCKAGGATKGLQQAGFYVVGVDIEPQPNYCGDEFIQADALTVNLAGFDAVWASPQCQAFSILNKIHKKEYPNLIDPIRQRLRKAKLPYIIENVVGAPLIDPIMLCGSQFGLKVYRHRLFESNCFLYAPAHYPHRDNTPAVGRGVSDKGFITVSGTGGFGVPDGFNYACKAMGIDWMSRRELSQAIPPAYSAFLGRQILAVLNHRFESTDAVDTIPPQAQSAAVSL